MNTARCEGALGVPKSSDRNIEVFMCISAAPVSRGEGDTCVREPEQTLRPKGSVMERKGAHLKRWYHDG